ncbi:MAG: hypothetical protein OXG44_12390 [Gammaproteobacteria bacterium]|nr:hypothetical protein [Gammaproteobacteria bacterium]
MTAPQVAEAVFDSHRFVKRLTEAGMERGLAEVLAEEHMGPWIRNVATKTDVENLRREAATKADMELVRKDLDHVQTTIRGDVEKRIAELRADLIKWMFGALMAQGALVVAIIKLFS